MMRSDPSNRRRSVRVMRVRIAGARSVQSALLSPRSGGPEPGVAVLNRPESLPQRPTPFLVRKSAGVLGTGSSSRFE